MKRIFKGIILFALILFPCKVIAAESAFDAAYYAGKYPDVKEAYGNNAELLYTHYLVFGAKEGRFANLQEEISKSGSKPKAQAAEKTGGLLYPTYIDVNIAAQTVTYYENGVMVMQGPCVSGNVSRGMGTPKGVFSIVARTGGKYLTGPTWNVWVNYWLRFTTNGACGFHDASWRSADEFGGTTYLRNGSHGCVNLPPAFAQQLFERVALGTIVAVY